MVYSAGGMNFTPGIPLPVLRTMNPKGIPTIDKWYGSSTPNKQIERDAYLMIA